MQGQGQHLLVPVVVGDLTDQGTAVVIELQVGGQPGFEGLPLQGAPAEAMDGGDVGAVELFEGQQQAGLQQSGIGCVGGLVCVGKLVCAGKLGDALQPGRQHRIGRRPLGIFQASQGQLQPLTNAIPQFCRSAFPVVNQW